MPQVPQAPHAPRQTSSALSVAIAVGLFRRLSGLMPRRYRQRHRDEAVDLMACLAAEAHRRRGLRGVTGVTCRASLDLIVRVLMARLSGSQRLWPRSSRSPSPQPRSWWSGSPSGSPLDGSTLSGSPSAVWHSAGGNSLGVARARVSPGERLRAVLDGLRRDAAYGVRSLRRRPLSSLAAVATLAIGIGLNAAVFSVVDWVLLRPLPYPSPHELVKVFTAGTAPVTAPADLTWSEFDAFSRAATLRASTAVSSAVRVTSGPGLEPAHVVIARVAGDLFGTFGVYPEIGRGFDRQEMASGAAVVVVSHAFWRDRFAADPAIAGRLLSIDDRPHTIVGVMPAGRSYPHDADVWRPLTADERADDDRENVMIGRLGPNMSADRATAEIATIARVLSAPAGAAVTTTATVASTTSAPTASATTIADAARGGAGHARTAPASARTGSTTAGNASPGTGGAARTAWVEDVQRTEVRDVRAVLTALWASAALILLMACANVAALLSARAADRVGQMAVRGALGASRARLLGQLLIESLLLATAGGVGGLLVGGWTLDLLLTVAPGELPRLDEIVLDGRVVAIGIAATLVVGLIVGLAPSYRASRLDLRACLGQAGSARTSGRARGRRLLVAAQTAMAVVLTISAGLLARSLQHLVTIDHGFAPDRLVAVDLYLHGDVGGGVRQLFRALIESAEAVPGVRSAAVAGRLPTLVSGLRVAIRVEGRDANGPVARGVEASRARPAPATPRATLRPITPRYFDTVGVALTSGRAFTAADREAALQVAIVNATFVRDILGGAPAVGTRLTASLVDGPLTIVGVVADVTPAGEADRAALYVSLDQIEFGGGSLLVRTEGDPRLVLPALTARLRATAPALALDKIQHVADALEAGRAVTRFNMQLASAFAGLALLLAAIGLYGLTAGEVASRWRELAVRLALGATRRDALWTVMRPGAGALAAGLIAGLAAALGVGRWMAALLHGIEPADPATLLAAPVVLAAVGLVSASLAAARILHADPAATLRRE